MFNHKKNIVQQLAPFGKGNGEMENVPFPISFKGREIIYLVSWKKTYPIKKEGDKYSPGKEVLYPYKNMLYGRTLGKKIVAQVYCSEEGSRGSYYLEVLSLKGIKRGDSQIPRLSIQGYLIDHEVVRYVKDEKGKILLDENGEKLRKKEVCHTRMRAPLEVIDGKIFASIAPNSPFISVMDGKFKFLYSISLENYKTHPSDTERVMEYNKKDQYLYCNSLHCVEKNKLLILTNRRFDGKALAILIDTRTKIFKKVLLPLMEVVPGVYWPIGGNGEDNSLMQLYRTGEKGVLRIIRFD